ncbi:MAG: hypothetical protein GX422_15505 [Deltaproteobacteria bacterium]|jgi:hypothetical protein|nr:hypothetical protein [Deltaproteobacteria bacterium]
MGELIDLDAHRNGRKVREQEMRITAELLPPYILLCSCGRDGLIKERQIVLSEYCLRCIMEEAADFEENP